MKKIGKGLKKVEAVTGFGYPGRLQTQRAAPGARPPVPVGAPGASARSPLTLQDDLFERLPLQPVPAPQLLRDVALPAGEVGGAETRRHVARCPGASAPPIQAGTGGHEPQHEATSGRRKAGSPTAHLHAKTAPDTIRNSLPAPDGNGFG